LSVSADFAELIAEKLDATLMHQDIFVQPLLNGQHQNTKEKKSQKNKQ